MVRRSFRRGLRLGLLIGIAFAVVKVMQSRRANDEPPPHVAPPSPWPPVDRTSTASPVRPAEPARPAEPEPVMEAATFVEAPAVVEETPAPRRERPLKAAPPPPAKKRAAKKAAASARAADARIWVEPTGNVCPPSHPIKAKLNSKLFHLPGMLAYDRCKPDRCYATEPDAVADGLQKAKR